MCRKPHRRELVQLLPLMCAIVFLVELHITGALYYDYDTLGVLKFLSNIFHTQFATLAISLVVCIICYIFLRPKVKSAQFAPFLLFCCSCFVCILLFTVQGFSCYIFKKFELTEDLLIKELNKLACRDKGFPKFLKNYQVINSCCIFRDRCWTWTPNATTPVFSCCPSILKCASSNDWYKEPCMPMLLQDYGLYAKVMLLMNIFGLAMMLLLFIYYASIYCRAKADKKRLKQEEKSRRNLDDEDENDNDDDNENGDGDGGGDEASKKNSEPSVALCLCSC